MGFLNTDSMPRLVEKLADGDNIKITGNSKGNRVGTVVKKIVEKADDVTKAIEQEVVNDSYSFKVGTGDVDVSADVQDGFGEIGLKGVTYQNVIEKYEFLLSDSCSFRDGCITVSPREGAYSNAFIQKGNLFKPSTKYTVIFNVIENTLDCKFYLYTYHESYGVSIANPSVATLGAGQKGIYKLVITTLSDITNCNTAIRSFIDNKGTDMNTNIKYQVFVLEGDHTNNPNLPSYFEGIVGVGDKSKNLFNGKLEEGQLDTTGLPIAAKDRCRSVDYIEVEKNTEYRIQINNTQSNAPWTTVFLYDSNKNYINSAQDSHGSSNLTFNTGEAKYIKFKLNVKASSVTKAQVSKGSSDISYEPYYEGNKIEILSNGKNLWNGKMYSGWGGASPTMDELGCRDNVITDFIRVARNKNCFINKAGFAYAWLYDLNKNLIDAYHGNINAFDNGVATKNADYIILGRSLGSSQINKEEYMDTIISYNKNDSFIESKSDKTQILLDEPLMRLPNGVCDEITRDGKLIRRIRKIVFTGDETESWIKKNNYGDVTRFDIELADIKPMGDIFSDTFVKGDISSPDKEFINIHGFSKLLQIQIKTSKITSDSVSGFKEWLSRNYVTAYYELETPVITELPAPCLRMFKDGHLTFNTLVAPESSHVVQLNKSAQIERSIREVQGLDSRVGQLESFYDDMMLETNHKLSLLNYDFEYTRERNGE